MHCRNDGSSKHSFWDTNFKVEWVASMMRKGVKKTSCLFREKLFVNDPQANNVSPMNYSRSLPLDIKDFNPFLIVCWLYYATFHHTLSQCQCWQHANSFTYWKHLAHLGFSFPILPTIIWFFSCLKCSTISSSTNLTEILIWCTLSSGKDKFFMPWPIYQQIVEQSIKPWPEGGKRQQPVELHLFNLHLRVQWSLRSCLTLR